MKKESVYPLILREKDILHAEHYLSPRNRAVIANHFIESFVKSLAGRKLRRDDKTGKAIISLKQKLRLIKFYRNKKNIKGAH